MGDNKLKRFISLALVLLLVALIGGCGKKTATQEEEVLVPVEIAKTRLADLTHTLNTTGEIIPFTEVAVAPKVTGRLAAIHVKVGDRVSRGQVLLELDATEARNAKTMAEAGVGVARANLDKAKQGLADAELEYNRSTTPRQRLKPSWNRLKACLTMPASGCSWPKNNSSRRKLPCKTQRKLTTTTL